MQTESYTESQLIDIIAKNMRYGRSHHDDWLQEKNERMFRYAMESISMGVACWLAANTLDGGVGVEWDVAMNFLMRTKQDYDYLTYRVEAERLVKLYGGIAK